MTVIIQDSDYTTKVPYGFKGEKISIAEMIKTQEFTSLEPLFAERILSLIRDNPSVGILKGGGGRDEEQVRNLFYANYKKIPNAPDYENDPARYEDIKSGKIKWNPEDNEWYKRVTNKTVAVPGASWHTGGYAVDFTGNVALAGKVSKKYQLEQITGTGETHHFQPLGVPISKRMFLELKNTYGIDAIKTPLSSDILMFINKEIASNVPRHPARIKKVLDAAIAKFKLSSGTTDEGVARERVLTGAGRFDSGIIIDWGRVPTVTPAAISKALTTTTTTSVPTTRSTIGGVGRIPGVDETTTTSSSTTTMAPSPTTTLVPTTTTVPEPVGGQRSAAPSKAEFGPRVSPTTSTTIPVTTTSPNATSTTMAPKNSPTTTTTQPPTTESTVPGSGATTSDVFTPSAGTGYAGGIDPNYQGLDKNPTYKAADPTNPYTYSTGDWQSILSFSPDKIISIQQQLMKAFPGFIPGVLGDKTDPKTIKAYKQALSRINLLNQDTSSPLRGKKIDEQITLLTKNPAASATSSSSLPTYQLNNPAELKAVFKKAAQDSLGRNLGEGDLNSLVESYQAQQLAYQRKVASGGTVTTPLSAETFATQSIEKDFGTEVNTQKMDNIFGAIDQALSGGQ